MSDAPPPPPPMCVYFGVPQYLWVLKRCHQILTFISIRIYIIIRVSCCLFSYYICVIHFEEVEKNELNIFL